MKKDHEQALFKIFKAVSQLESFDDDRTTGNFCENCTDNCFKSALPIGLKFRSNSPGILYEAR